MQRAPILGILCPHPLTLDDQCRRGMGGGVFLGNHAATPNLKETLMPKRCDLDRYMVARGSGVYY